MKINYKLYLELLFYITGTAITIAIFTTVGINFAKDTRFFGNTTLTIVEESPKEEANNNDEAVGNGGKITETIYYSGKSSIQQNSKKEPEPDNEKPAQTETPKTSATTERNASPDRKSNV